MLHVARSLPLECLSMCKVTVTLRLTVASLMHVDSAVSGIVSAMAVITHGNSEALSLPLLQV